MWCIHLIISYNYYVINRAIFYDLFTLYGEEGLDFLFINNDYPLVYKNILINLRHLNTN